MKLGRASAPVVVALVAGLAFAIARPALADSYSDGLQGRLNWGATGLVLWLIFGVALSMRDLRET